MDWRELRREHSPELDIKMREEGKGARSREGFGGPSLLCAEGERGVYRTFNIPHSWFQDSKPSENLNKLPPDLY